MFISEALAQATNVATTTEALPGGEGFKVFIQFALIFLVLYLLLIRPQQKRMKQHEAELNAIVKGTKIIVSGMLGTVVEVIDDEKLLVELSKEVRVTVLRSYVSQVLFDDSKKSKKK